ncbi:pyridoxal phosphate-dependent transferase [Aspergillus ambiguus]|uniref:threonine aldolase family protein n=1 Tax=Aspergillus ambiguus TaxID=176160 RepID=UPI003CCCE0E2
MPSESARASNEFRSDTFTTPTPAMLEAMATATFGDDVYGEDRTTNEFQTEVARLTGMEEALFMLSGTMGNQIGVRVHLTQPPHSVLCDYRAHVYAEEGSGLAVLSQAMVTPVHPANGIYLTLDDVQKWVTLGDDIHTAPTKVISLEVTIGGVLTPLDEIRKISEFAHANGIKVHCDGARLWNASAASGHSLADYCQYFDSVSMCVSKGLGAPVGGVLASTKQNIKQARWLRKQQGGGIRQAGVLTAAAMVALRDVWPTMKRTHERTKQLEADLKALGVVPQIPVDTNFYFIDAERSKLDMGVLLEQCEKFDVKLMDERISMHHQVSDEAIENLKRAIAEAVEITKSLPPGHVSSRQPAGKLNILNVLTIILLVRRETVILLLELLPRRKCLSSSQAERQLGQRNTSVLCDFNSLANGAGGISSLVHQNDVDEEHHAGLGYHILASHKHREVHPRRGKRRTQTVSAGVEPLVAESILIGNTSIRLKHIANWAPGLERFHASLHLQDIDLMHATGKLGDTPNGDGAHQTRMCELSFDLVLSGRVPGQDRLVPRNHDVLVGRVIAATFIDRADELPPQVTLVGAGLGELEGADKREVSQIGSLANLAHFSLRLDNAQIANAIHSFFQQLPQSVGQGARVWFVADALGGGIDAEALQDLGDQGDGVASRVVGSDEDILLV